MTARSGRSRWTPWSGSGPGRPGLKPSDLRAARTALLDDPAVTGPALRAALTDLADTALAPLVADERGVALVAVGGYARGEPAPGSDLDLLLVVGGRRDVAAVAERVWYPLWDAGLSVDHAVRTVEQAREVAGGDLRAALGLLDVRHLSGDAGLSDELGRVLRADWRAGAARRLPELAASVHERARSAGDLAHLLEPDLKQAAGGLRDVGVLRALAAGWLADPPRGRVRDAHQLLLDVRGELHRAARRSADRLTRQEQAAVAAALRLADEDALLARVSASGRTISFALEQAFRRLTPAGGGGRFRRRQPRRPLGRDVVAHGAEVTVALAADVAQDRTLAFRLAAAAARADLPISPATLDRVAAAFVPLDPWPPEARQSLVELLGAGRPAVAVIEALDQAGLLLAMLPEWAAVRYRPQHNPLHTFTVDRHLVETAVQAAALARDVTRPDLLLVAAFLHDLGKGATGDHSAAGAQLVDRVGRRMGFDPGDVRVLATLVRHHLLLADVATRRDLDDPDTVETVVAAVGDRGTLDLLAALSRADAVATGGNAWTPWRARLLADLVDRCRRRLAGEPVPPPRLPEGTDRLLGTAAPAVSVEPRDDGSLVVAFAAPDRPGLLAAAAGVLALHRLDVRAATATSAETTAVTSFDVLPRFGLAADADRLVLDLRRALTGGLPVTDALRARARADPAGAGPVAAPVIRLADAPGATVVELRAHDAVGLLHRVTLALGSCGLDVRAARIATFGAEVVDVFYVTGTDGSPLSADGAREQVVAAVRAALDG